MCGCTVNTNLNNLLKMKEIDILIKNNDKDKIYNAIISFSDKKNQNKPYYFNTDKDGSFNFMNKEMSQHSRAFLKVQDGCDNYCSYCKIPYARGKSRSRNINDIIKEISFFVQSGYKEVVLTGINLGSYKFDNINLSRLIQILIENFPEIRIRLSSIELQYIDDSYIKVFNHKNICPHIHIPLQSGSNKILKLMNRKYTTNEYYEKIKLLCNAKNNPFISTDLILGFPGESNDDFSNTIKFIKKVNFSFIHVFGYSQREETVAYNIKNRVCERIRDERIKKVNKIVDEMNYNYRKRFLNKKLEVVIEEIKENYYRGKSENYLNLLIFKDNKKIEKRNKYDVVFTKIIGNQNYAKIL